MPENRSEMSPVMLPPGTQTFSAQVLPPSVETKIGALPEPAGSGVNAESAIWRGLAGLALTLASLSCRVSSLSGFGMTLTTRVGTAQRSASLAVSRTSIRPSRPGA